MSQTKLDDIKYLAFDTTPPNLPVNFEIADLPYIGEMKIWGEAGITVTSS
jgi:hypothetical protein